MARVIQTKGTTLYIEDKAFASGGEGDLHKIVSPATYHSQVVKIYKAEKRTREREEKIAYLAANAPAVNHEEHQSLIWVSDTVYENGKFAGFLMPLAKGEKLELLCHPTQPKILKSEWNKFDFKSTEGIKLRQKICFNIAVAIYHVHKLGKYVLADMKPENIMIQPNGLISIIDIDSVAVVNNQKILYPAPVVTPDYTPPEYYNGVKGKEIKDETWDRFCMAVIFYRLLCGIHPFTGSCNPPYDKYNGIAEMIEHGLFPNSPNGKFFKVIPPPHANFNRLESAIQEMFTKCFFEAQTNPGNRPSATEWCKVLIPPEIKIINRALPSGKLAFPHYSLPRPLVFTPDIAINFPVINFLNPKKNIINNILDNILGRANKQKIATRVLRCENQLKAKILRKLVFEKELIGIVNKFQLNQTEILSYGKNEIDKLRKDYLTEIERRDQVSKNLSNQERDETNLITERVNDIISDLDKKAAESHFNIIESQTTLYQKNKSKIESDINASLRKIGVETNKLIIDPEKLSKYRIDVHAYSIFSSYEILILQNLSFYGFNTAADFTDVNLSGKLKNRSHKWIKVPGIAKVRGQQLGNWRKNLELMENTSIIDSVKTSYQNKIDGLNFSLQYIEKEYRNNAINFQKEYSSEKEKLDNLRKQSTQLYKKQIEEIEGKYNQLQLKLFSDANETLAPYTANIAKISQGTTAKLNKNLDQHKKLLSDKMEEINNFIAELQIDIIQMAALHEEFTR